MTSERNAGLPAEKPTTWSLFSYPEANPYRSDPPIPNLIPGCYDESEFDTPELREAVFAIAHKHYINALCVMYGTNPFHVLDEELLNTPLPIKSYEAPPSLPEVKLPETLALVEQMNPLGNSPLFKILVDGKVLLLKIFPDREPEENFEPRRYNSDLEEPDYPQLFEREKEAYAHLRHYGACQKGAVPNCYGWLRLTESQRTCVQEFPGLRGVATTIKYDESPPTGILLEYFDNAERISLGNVTEDVSEKAMRGLCEIHASYVRHGDIHRRNVLLLPDGRVVWIDFDNSACASNPKLWRQHFVEELHRAWGYFYPTLLADKRIGYRDPWY